jgi:hypothetical protein
MRARTKLALVAAGYVAAFLVATAAVMIHVAWTAGADRQGASGMFAFGDTLLFLAGFGAAAVPATVVGLVFLRPHPWFWRVLATAAVVIAATGLLSLGVIFAARTAGSGSELQAWSALAVLRILAAPLAALAFLLSGVIAPRLPARIALGTATVSEIAIFACWLIRLP